MNTNYEEEVAKIEAEKQQTLTEAEQLYGNMVEESGKYYDKLVENTQAWTAAQSAAQQAQTDFAIEQIEQEKEQAKKDYTKEQSGAFVDYKKESNRYGANAEQMEASGLANTGYSESSQVNIYNTYQNRVSSARESYNLAVMNYNNAIKEARLQNSSILADIAYQGLQQQIQISLQGFQYENQLLLDQLSTKMAIDDTYHNRYLDVLNQINTENELKERQRQFDAEMARLKALDALEQLGSSQGALGIMAGINNGMEEAGENTTKFTRDSMGRILPDESAADDADQLFAGIYRETAANYAASQKTERLEALNYIEEAKANEKTNKNASALAEKLSTYGTTNYANRVNTEYYQGELNPDADKFGTFGNGYQPLGISGHGYLRKTGDTVEFYTKTSLGKTRYVKQNVWQASDRTYWYWDGSANEYKRYYYPGKGGNDNGHVFYGREWEDNKAR